MVVQVVVEVIQAMVVLILLDLAHQHKVMQVVQVQQLS
jgi:hypothetical protein